MIVQAIKSTLLYDPTMFASILIALAAAAPADNAMPIDAAKALHESRSAVLYSLEPWSDRANPSPALHRFQILGQKRIDGAAYKAAAEEFEAAVGRWDDRMAACFDPRHGLSVTSGGHQFEFLLCYACHQMAVYRDGEQIGTLGAAGSSKPLNALLAAAKLPISKSYDEYAELARARQAEEQYQRWRAATPRSLLNIHTGSGPIVEDDVVAHMAAALAVEQPRINERVLVLLGWFGAGAGPWSGFPAYEDVPEKLLLMYSTQDLLGALNSAQLSKAQLEGAARLFGGWTFGKERPADRSKLSPAWKARLLAHALGSRDKDKRDRAMHAFGPQ
jgi:hypothetical protein